MAKSKTKVSIIMPCLNEEKTVGLCIEAARDGLRKLAGMEGEIIVIDNDSTDQSAKFAKQAGASVISEKKRGYGSAYKAGISVSQGDFIIIGDSDGTYDFRQIDIFVSNLSKGSDLVLGSRLRGKIEKGAMPFFHRYLGNPLLTFILNFFYSSKITDAHTGMRGFTKSAYKKMNIKSSGMEFASEMIIKAIYHKMKIHEVPINYSNRSGRSKLSPIADAWRHIRCMLLYSPTYLYLAPGLLFFILGSVISLVLLPKGQIIFGRFFDVHTMSLGVLLANLGLQLILLGVFARLYTQNSLGLPSGPLANFILNKLTPGKVLVSGITFVLIGIFIIGIISIDWLAAGGRDLSRIREFIFAVGLTIIGAELLFSSFLYDLMTDYK